jgi:hypothetical protein
MVYRGRLAQIQPTKVSDESPITKLYPCEIAKCSPPNLIEFRLSFHFIWRGKTLVVYLISLIDLSFPIVPGIGP